MLEQLADKHGGEKLDTGGFRCHHDLRSNILPKNLAASSIPSWGGVSLRDPELQSALHG